MDNYKPKDRVGHEVVTNMNGSDFTLDRAQMQLQAQLGGYSANSFWRRQKDNCIKGPDA